MKITKEFYQAVIEFSDYDHAAPADDLTRTQDLARFGWCKVCDTGFKPGGDADRERLVQVGICKPCDFNMRLFNMRNDKETARINGQHYRVACQLETTITATDSLDDMVEKMRKQNPGRQGLGMGGEINIIRFADGRTIMTNDLWHQGAVPETMAHLMPDNAEFVK